MHTFLLNKLYAYYNISYKQISCKNSKEIDLKL